MYIILKCMFISDQIYGVGDESLDINLFID